MVRGVCGHGGCVPPAHTGWSNQVTKSVTVTPILQVGWMNIDEHRWTKALAFRHLWVSSCPVIGTPQIWCLVDEPCWLSIVTWARWVLNPKSTLGKSMFGPNMTGRYIFFHGSSWTLGGTEWPYTWSESVEPDFMICISKVMQDRN